MAEQFHPLTLPDNLRRDSVLQAKFRPDGYMEALDRETLWYDASWNDGRVTVIGPPLNNLQRDFRKAEFRVDGAPAKLWRMRRYRRHFEAQFLAEKVPASISIRLNGWTGSSPVSRAAPELFQGLNTLFYLNKNNDLRWIQDHARWHRQEHGAQAVLVVDNGSTAYATDDISEALKSVGLDRVMVLSAPFKYGPMGLKPYRRTEKYMQVAVFNVLRQRFLGQAGAILNCDVDELIARRADTSVFDAARTSRIGFVQVPGMWVYAAPGREGPFLHRDHVYAHPVPKKAPPKWCLVPSGALGKCSWDIHGFERLPFLRSRLHRDFFFLHCRGVSTGWKGAGRLKMPGDTVPNRDAAEVLARMPAE